MKKAKKILCFLGVLATVFFAACSVTGPEGPAGSGGTGLIMVNFQQGVYPDATYAGNTDTRLYSAYSERNYGSCANFSAGYSEAVGKERSLVKFDISGLIPPGAVITNAYLSLYVYYYLADTTWKFYEVTTDWTEGTGTCGGSDNVNASWDYYDGSANSWAASGGGGDFEASAASDSVTITGDLEDYITFSITPSIVQKWLDSPAQNLGLIMKAENEITDSSAAVYSSEISTLSYRPRLTVYYTAP